MPDGAFRCCNESSDCNSGFCIEFSIPAGGDLGVCSPRPPEAYCDGEDATIRHCHTGPAGSVPVPWEEGDCDGDGLINEADPTPCTPQNRAILIDGSCVPLAECVSDACDRLPNGEFAVCLDLPPGGLCVAFGGEKEVNYCFGGPDDYRCSLNEGGPVVVDGIELCVPEACPGSMPPVHCITFDDDRRAVPWNQGDCDRDGIRNQAEMMAGTNPCIADLDAGMPTDGGTPDGGTPDAGSGDAGPADGGSGPADGGSGPADGGTMPGDAGPPPADAGTPPTDAAGPMDGGRTTVDAGGEDGLGFSGGGGCACRVRPATRGELPLGLLMLAGVLALRRRRAR